MASIDPLSLQRNPAQNSYGPLLAYQDPNVMAQYAPTNQAPNRTKAGQPTLEDVQQWKLDDLLKLAQRRFYSYRKRKFTPEVL